MKIAQFISHFSKQRVTILLFLFVCIGCVFRLYNLNWGAPYYFHPDERNIAGAITQLSFPHQMNPHFFAYGSLPIYTIYFFALFLSQFTDPSLHVSFDVAILASRILSAMLSLGLIPLVFLIGRKIADEKTGLVAAGLTTLSTGLIQFSHFGTFEMWLTFFSTVFFLLCLSSMKTLSIGKTILLGIVCGVLIGIKVTSLIFIPVGIFLIWIHLRRSWKRFFTVLGFTAVFLSLIGLIYLATNPFTILDYPSFQNSMRYESSVTLGTLPVFYTGEFFGKLPIIFQMLHIYPFIANPFITILFIPAFLFTVFLSIKKRNGKYALLLGFYLLLFLSQAFLFTKWTRYIIPTLPFMYLIIAASIQSFKQSLFKITVSILLLTSSVFAAAFVYTVYGKNDTRVEAYEWAKAHIPANARVMSEVYDLGIVPFNATYHTITLVNTYDLDNGTPEISLDPFSYLILPSQRIYKTRVLDPKHFPNGYRIYTHLFAGKLGFKKQYETPCDILCKIAYSGNPVFSLEETATVFDRPTIYIFKRL